jgi:hypothetical protein
MPHNSNTDRLSTIKAAAALQAAFFAELIELELLVLKLELLESLPFSDKEHRPPPS